MFEFKRWLTAAAVVSGAVIMVAASAQADPVPFNVNPVSCSLTSGTRGVPVGSPIRFRTGVAEQKRGTVTSWLNAQTTTVSWSLNGGPFSSPVDLSNLWPDPAQRADGSWVSFNEYLPGIALAWGDVLRVSYSESLSHIVPEVYNPSAEGGAAGKPLFNLPHAAPYTCVVTPF